MAANYGNHSTVEKYAVVTGANKGIGFETARQLAIQGITVVLTARNEKRGLVATSTLHNMGLTNVVFHQLDVTEQESVDSLAKFIEDKFGRLDILVNNAAHLGVVVDEKRAKALDIDEEIRSSGTAVYRVQYATKTTYQSAIECWNTNYFGVKRLTEALLPLLQLSTSGARIVNVTTRWGELQRIPDGDLRKELGDVKTLTEAKLDAIYKRFLKDLRANKLEAGGWSLMFPAYSISKSTLNAYTRILAKKHPKMLINCVHPGSVNTDMTYRTGVMPVEKGAAAPLKCALLPEGGPTGCYFCQLEVVDF